jgi:SAM-dependent methyltransferase
MDIDNWDRHWDEYAASAESNPAQRFRRRLVRSVIAESMARGRGRILDLGSGQGDLAAELVRDFPNAEVLGVELSEAGVRIASRKVLQATFLQQDLLQRVPWNSPYRAWADFAVCSEVLEHLDDPVLFLKNSAALMSPGCKLIVTVPGGPMSAFDKHIGHRRHFSRLDLTRVLEDAGFPVVTVQASGYPFFNLYRRVVILRGAALIQDVSSRPNVLARWSSEALMALFRLLFTMNKATGSRGWQMLAVAQWPGSETDAAVEYGTSGEESLSGSNSQVVRSLK